MNYIDPRQKIVWHLDRLLDLKQTGRTRAPVNVEIDLSNRCSLGCEWCHFGYTHTMGPLSGEWEGPADRISGGDLMERTLAFTILGELSKAGVQSVTWSGGGEPTLHPDFDTIVKTAVNSGLQQGLYTHGGHIDQGRAKLLRERLLWVYVSLDECNQVDYKRSKGTDGFGRATAGIENLADAKGPAVVGVGFQIHSGNYKQAGEMVRLGRVLGADYVQFRPTIRFDAQAPGVVTEDRGWMTEAREILGGLADDPFVIVDLQRFAEYQLWLGHGYTTCFWSGMQAVISPNGKVWRCANKREFSSALLGDLAAESFADIWQRAGGACSVDAECRVMCRGHVPNQAIGSIMTEPVHSAFV